MIEPAIGAENLMVSQVQIIWFKSFERWPGVELARLDRPGQPVS
jgi:hypothetical protein